MFRTVPFLSLFKTGNRFKSSLRYRRSDRHILENLPHVGVMAGGGASCWEWELDDGSLDADTWFDTNRSRVTNLM